MLVTGKQAANNNLIRRKNNKNLFRNKPVLEQILISYYYQKLKNNYAGLKKISLQTTTLRSLRLRVSARNLFCVRIYYID